MKELKWTPCLQKMPLPEKANRRFLVIVEEDSSDFYGEVDKKVIIAFLSSRELKRGSSPWFFDILPLKSIENDYTRVTHWQPLPDVEKTQ